MPELPDVEQFRRFLNRTAAGRKIKAAEVRDEWILRGASAAQFQAHVVGKSFTRAQRHGKYLFAALAPRGFIVFHFGMTGFLRSFTRREIEPEYNRVIFSLDNGVHVAFNCRRRLGSVRYAEDAARFAAERNLGPDVLTLDFDGFLERLRGRKGLIKCVLLDQSIMAGIGNIYADEALFRARLHPRTPLTAIDRRQRRILFDAIVRVLNAAIRNGADASRFLRGYLTPQRSRTGVCPRCGASLASLAVCGRTAYFCPREQRLRS